MISRIALILFLVISAAAVVSAQSQPSQLTKEEEQKKQGELRKKVKEALERVINFSTVLARVYARPLTLRDLVNFLDGTKSLSK